MPVNLQFDGIRHFPVASAAPVHDITSGRSGSFSATTGFDLVTGWGSPKPGLINELAP